MPAKHSYPTMESLDYLLRQIHNRDMALPDFQRDFVWALPVPHEGSGRC
jgi:hypothetical protein